MAGYGACVAWWERHVYADSRVRGVVFTTLAVAAPTALGAVAESAIGRPGSGRAAWRHGGRIAATALVTWAVLGGESLAREGEGMAGELGRGEIDGARARLRNLCAREAGGLGPDELARATVESLAENASDAVVGPLVWGAVAGVPGLVGYRAANTLDAMVGYRSEPYRRFGWASARFDDLVNLVPSRLTALITVGAARSVGGSAVGAWRIWRRDASAHPSPNAGQVEAAFAGALDLRLGGANTYHGEVETRPTLGEGRPPGPEDIARAVGLGRAVTVGAALLAAGLAVAVGGRRPPRSATGC